MKDTCCFKNLNKAIRKGRANYACPICGGDVSLAFFYYCEAIKSSAKTLGSKGGKARAKLPKDKLKAISAMGHKAKKEKKGLST